MKGLFLYVDSLANAKGFSVDKVLHILEDALVKVARSRYGYSADLHMHVNRNNGTIDLGRHLKVCEEVNDNNLEICLADARSIEPEAEVGDTIVEILKVDDFARVSIAEISSILRSGINLAEREMFYDEFKDRVGQLFTGNVKRLEGPRKRDVVVGLGHVEALLPADNLINREVVSLGQSIKAVVSEVTSRASGYQVVLSRTHNNLLAELLTLEVPEIKAGNIIIKNIVREPGSRAKVSVHTNFSYIDPVGSCIGVKGKRIQAVIDELKGEKIDVVLWSEDQAIYIVAALKPGKILKIITDDEKRRAEVIVTDDSFVAAIGRGGQNVRLASKLTGWRIDVLPVSESVKRQEELVAKMQEDLELDDTFASLLVVNGFDNAEKVLKASDRELLTLPGIDLDLIEELRQRAREYKESVKERMLAELRLRGADERLAKLAEINLDILNNLLNNEVFTLEDLANLDIDQLRTKLKGLKSDFYRIEKILKESKEAVFLGKSLENGD